MRATVLRSLAGLGLVALLNGGMPPAAKADPTSGAGTVPADGSAVQATPKVTWAQDGPLWRFVIVLDVEGMAAVRSSWRTELRDQTGALLVSPASGTDTSLWVGHQSTEGTSPWCGVLPAASGQGFSWELHPITSLTGTVFFDGIGQQVSATAAADLSACPGGVAQTPTSVAGAASTATATGTIGVSVRTSGRKVRVDIDPDRAKGSYRVSVERQVGSGWRRYGTRHTKGKRELLVLKLHPGTYRVRVPDQAGLLGWTTPTFRVR